jgi:dual specificity protein phosphatase-like protein
MPHSPDIARTQAQEPQREAEALAAEHERVLDMHWITDRLALGGCIDTQEKMQLVARQGITHILNMAWESDESALAGQYGIRLYSNGVLDDFQPKPHEVLERGTQFAQESLRQDGTRLLIHCLAGRHRGPMMTLAVLCVQGWKLEEAMQRISERRPVVDWSPVYVDSVRLFLEQRSRETAAWKGQPAPAGKGFPR